MPTAKKSLAALVCSVLPLHSSNPDGAVVRTRMFMLTLSLIILETYQYTNIRVDNKNVGVAWTYGLLIKVICLICWEQRWTWKCFWNQAVGLVLSLSGPGEMVSERKKNTPLPHNKRVLEMNSRRCFTKKYTTFSVQKVYYSHIVFCISYLTRHSMFSTVFSINSWYLYHNTISGLANKRVATWL